MVLIGILFFSLIAAMLLMGVGTYAVGHQTRAHVDANYAAAIDMAEAGVNYELHKISTNPALADTTALTRSQPFGVAGTSFTVQCVNRGVSTAWSGGGASLDIVSTGTVNGVSRRVRITATTYGAGGGNYALFGVREGIINGSAATVQGNIGTNGIIAFNGHPNITGQVVFNGSGANWQSTPNGTYTVQRNSQAVTWPTVDALANQTVAGGLTWLASHNDNSLSNPPIGSTVILNGNTTLTLKGKPGGANYYLTNLTCNGNAKIAFDNTDGPINIWFGPSGSAGTCIFSGGTAAVKMAQDPTKAVKMYVATTNDIILNGNAELDAGIYNYNGSRNGRVIFNGNPTVYGAVVADTFALNGTPNLQYAPGYFQTSNGGYYGYENSWVEENGR